MTPVTSATSDTEFMNEFDRVQTSLYAKLAVLEEAPVTSSSKAFINRAYDDIDSTRSLDTLYIYDRLMFVQGSNAYRLFLLNSAMKFVRNAFPGEINSIFKQEHIDHLSTFEFITNRHGDLFPTASLRREQVAYLDTMRAAYILGGQEDRDYIADNIDPVCDVIAHRDITDPNLLLEVIEVMRSGSTALVNGTL